MNPDQEEEINVLVDKFLNELEGKINGEETSKKTETEEVIEQIIQNNQTNTSLPTTTQEQNQKRTSYVIINKDGLWEEIDAQTGDTISIQKPTTLAQKIKLKSSFHYLEVQHPTNPNKTILVDRRLNVNELKMWRPQNRGMQYSENIADIICDRVINGESLHKICKDSSMPSYSIVRRWRNEHPEFEDAYQLACRMRAERLVDEALDLARETEDPENIVGSAKLLIDQLKYMAQQEDPRKYSQKANIQDNNGNNVIFNIISGIPDSNYTEKIANRKLDDQGKVIDVESTTAKTEQPKNE